MALNWTNIQNALVAAVEGAVTGVTVVWAPQALTAPMVAKPFVTLHLASVDVAQGAVSGTMDELRNTADPLVWQWVHQRRHVLSLSVYSNETQRAGSAFDILSQINRRLQLASVQAALLAAGVRLWQTSGVRDLSAMLDTRGEGRAQCDYALATQDTTADAIGNIETVDLSGVDVEAP